MLTIGFEETERLEVLFLGAHCDDIEIGAGGLALELAARRPDATVHWVVLTSNAQREAETRAAAARFLDGVANVNVVIRDFRNGFFPWVGADIKEFFESLKQTIAPQLIVTHFRGDLHQDHRTVGELTWNTWRDHMICEYEIPKYDGGLGSPNLFVPLSAATMERKVAILLEEFASQRARQWFTEDTFRGLARLRGIECNAPDGFAEAYYVSKSVLEL